MGPFRWTGATAARHDAAVWFLFAFLACWLAGTPSWAVNVERVDVRHGQVSMRLDDSATQAVSLLRAPRPINDGGDRNLTLSFPAGARPAVTLAASEPAPAAAYSAARRYPKPRYQVFIPVPAPNQVLRLPRVYGDDPSRPLVVIDPGHGGMDPGAIASVTGLREKDVTLRIARAIRDKLLASGKVRVALTREDDHFIVLQERYGIARRLHANLFISIHCDSAPGGPDGSGGSATGASVYTLSEVASDKESARLAARENKADVIDGVNLGGQDADVSSILIDLTQRETMNSSAGFARLLGREAQPLVPMKPNFHRMASLMVLKAPDMPSILLETGYISNPADVRFIDSPGGRDRIAESIERAVEAFFARRLAAN